MSRRRKLEVPPHIAGVEVLPTLKEKSMAKEVRKPKATGKAAAANDDTEVHDGPPINADALYRQTKFNAEKLKGELGDFLLQDLRATRELKPWAKMSERDQELLIERCEKQSGHIVDRVVEAIAAKGIVHMDGQMEDAGSFKDGFFTMKVSVPMTAENALLLSRRSGAVQIVFATAKDFESPMSMRSEPDQAALIDDDEGDAGDEAEDRDETPAAQGGATATPTM